LFRFQMTARALEGVKEGGLLMGDVWYNSSALEHIRSESGPLYQQELLQRYLAEGRREIDEFPSGTVVLKTSWRRVPSDGTPVPVGIWDEALGNRAAVPERTWKNCVNVTTDPKRVSTMSSPCGMSSSGPIQGPTLSTEEFYSFRVGNPKDVQDVRLPEPDRSALQAGDQLILLGLHAAVKAIPDWVWATYWWKPHALQTAVEKRDRPEVLEKRKFWRNYLHGIGVSMRVPYDSAGFPVAVFNPFLEAGQLPNGTASNCMSCHSVATYPCVTADLSNAPYLGVGKPIDHFEARVKTDYLWSIPLNAGQGGCEVKKP
jgi:hypothetical protein